MNETAQMLKLLEQFPDISKMTALEARAAVNARVRPVQNLDDATSEDHIVPTPNGPLGVRLYRPLEALPGVPLVVYAHGGGFLHGGIASHDGFCRAFARGTQSPVLSVEYRLAPEHGAPAAAEDLVHASEWAVERGIADTIVLAGDSAGANAAAVAALTLRGHPLVRVTGQVLLTPFLDPEMAGQSYRLIGERSFVRASALATYWKHYLEAPGTAAAQPWQVNPALADDLAGLAPALIVTGGQDPLHDEGVDFAHRLRDAGVPVLLRDYPDQFHGFVTIPGYGPAASARSRLWNDFTHRLTTPKEPQP